MTQAVAVRRDGDTFQARQFWLRAARLLDPKSPLTRVGFESGPKSFDDIWVEYETGRQPYAHDGAPLRREHLQCKWHVAPGTYGYADTVERNINANARSLKRAVDAQLGTKMGPRIAFCQGCSDWKAGGARVKLVTHGQIDRSVSLAPGNKQPRSMRLDRVYGSGQQQSRRCPKSWREHLGIDRMIYEYWRTPSRRSKFLGSTISAIASTRYLKLAWFSLVEPEQADLRRHCLQWMAQGGLKFDRRTFREACAREDLLGQSQDRPRAYGVTFEHAFDRLEGRCDGVLDLVPFRRTPHSRWLLWKRPIRRRVVRSILRTATAACLHSAASPDPSCTTTPSGGCSDPRRWETSSERTYWTERSVPLLFEDRFGRPGKGNDKGKVDSTRRLRNPRNFLVDVPRPRASRFIRCRLSPNSCRRRQAARLRWPQGDHRPSRDRKFSCHCTPAPYDACDKRPGRAEFAVAGALPATTIPCPWPTATVRCSSGATSKRW